MPPVLVPVALAVAAGGAGVALGVTTFGAAALSVAVTAAAAGASYLMKPNVPATGAARTESTAAPANAQRSIPVSQAIPPRRFAYGQLRTGGALFFQDNANPDLFVGSALSDGTIVSVDQVYFGEIPIPLDASGDALSSSTYYERFSMDYATGAPGQTASPLLLAGFPDTLSADFKQTGVARAVVKLDWGTDAQNHQALWGSSISPTFLITGLRVYDPRDGAAALTQIAPADSTTSLGNTTFIDRSVALRNSHEVVSIGVYSQDAFTYTVKIAKQNSSTNFDFVVSESFSHPGGGWADHPLSTPYTVPGSGTYRLAAYCNQTTDVTASLARSTVSGNQAVATGVTASAATGVTVPMRYGIKPLIDDPTTWPYSDNPALAVAHALTNAWGIALDTDAVDWEFVATAADACDEAVSYDGFELPIFRLAGIFQAGVNLGSQISEMLSSFRGKIVFTNGKYGLVADGARSSVWTVTDDDILELGEYTHATEGRALFNAISALHYNIDDAGKQTTTEAYEIPSAIAEEGLRETSVNLPFTPDSHSAQIIAYRELIQTRDGRALSLRLTDAAIYLVPGEVITIETEGAAFLNGLFEVVQVDLADEGVGVTLRGYNPDVYADPASYLV